MKIAKVEHGWHWPGNRLDGEIELFAIDTRLPRTGNDSHQPHIPEKGGFHGTT
jgi:hypothetical protein